MNWTQWFNICGSTSDIDEMRWFLLSTRMTFGIMSAELKIRKYFYMYGVCVCHQSHVPPSCLAHAQWPTSWMNVCIQYHVCIMSKYFYIYCVCVFVTSLITMLYTIHVPYRIQYCTCTFYLGWCHEWIILTCEGLRKYLTSWIQEFHVDLWRDRALSSWNLSVLCAGLCFSCWFILYSVAVA